MYPVDQCSNCGSNVRPQLGVATATTVQHRECADRFGLGTHGQSIVLPMTTRSVTVPLAVAGAQGCSPR
jgi:hypothetical protein